MDKQDRWDLEELIDGLITAHDGLTLPDREILKRFGIIPDTMAEFVFDRIIKRHLEKVPHESKKE
jgi:hypothetical protein